MPGFEQLVITYGPVGGLAVFFVCQWWQGKQSPPKQQSPFTYQVEFARKSDVTALTHAVGNLTEELAEFTKEVRAGMVAHGERIAKSEARLEERKR